jgi:hypothetical protein
MTDQIVITEKTSQAKDVRAAIGGRYGAILPARHRQDGIRRGARGACRAGPVCGRRGRRFG